LEAKTRSPLTHNLQWGPPVAHEDSIRVVDIANEGSTTQATNITQEESIEIGKILHNKLLAAFSKVKFSELVDAACGIYTDKFIELLKVIFDERNELYSQFQKLPRLKKQYEAVESVRDSKTCKKLHAN
jgi:hypothetical protein